MLQELTTSVRRWARLVGDSDTDRAPLVRVASTSDDAVGEAHTDIGMLRGVTPAAADTAECTCPEPCERDHANE